MSVRLGRAKTRVERNGADRKQVSQQIKVFEPDYDGKYAPNDTSLFFTNETLHNWNELMPSECHQIS